MAQKGFFIDVSKCTGCRTCQVACSDLNNTPVGLHLRRVMEVEGYAYLEHVNYDGENSSVYLIVRNEQGGLMAYLATAEEGVSGVRHESIGKNLGLADFRVYVDVSGYSDGVYTLGTMLMCMHEGSEIRVSHRFPDALNFVVRGGEIITPVQIEETAEPSAPAASVTPTAPAQTPAA